MGELFFGTIRVRLWRATHVRVGIKEIEFDYTWHGKPPSKEEAVKFLAELRTLKGEIQSEHE